MTLPRFNKFNKIFGFWESKETMKFPINRLPNDLKNEILSYLDDDDLRNLSMTAKEWEKLAKQSKNYHNQIFYTHDFGKVRTKTISFNPNGGSGPVVVPIPSVNLDRHSNPNKQELIDAFINLWCDKKYSNSVYLYEKYKDQKNPYYQLNASGRTIFKILLKKDAQRIPNPNQGMCGYGEWSCKLDDIEKIIWAEINWGKERKHHVRYILNLPINEIKKTKTFTMRT